MNRTNSEQIAKWVDGVAHGSADITGVKVDNRMIEANDMFVCLVGERVDGHMFAQTAVDAGATLLLVDHKLDINVAQVVVKDTLDALRKLGRAYRDTLNAYFIGITGSNGKTSTKDMLYSILSLVGDTVATYKNQNTEIGTYLNLFRMNQDTKFGVFEMGLDMPGEVRTMTQIVKPDTALVTSLAPTHIVNFDNIEHIAKEKFAIFAGVSDETRKFYQGDFELYRELDHGYHTFGYNNNNEFVVSDVSSDNNGIHFSVNGVAYDCNLLGEHQASNAAGVIACLEQLNIPNEVIREGLSHVALTSLRMELVEKNESLVLLDAYKSNPISAIFALETLSNYKFSGDKIAVLSDMVELGDNAINHHIEVLDAIERLNLMHVYLYGPDFKKALDATNYDTSKYTVTEDFDELYKTVQPLFLKQEMILIKGSRSYALERLMKED